MDDVSWAPDRFPVAIAHRRVPSSYSADQDDRVSLEPRRLSHYLPGFTRIDAWIIAGILALLAVLGVAVPSEELRPIEPAEIRSSAAWYLVLCVLGIGISVGTRLMQEAIVRRRQSFDSIDETQADGALRSASIQGLAGVGYGGPMFIAAVMAWDLAFSTEDPSPACLTVLSYLPSPGLAC